MSMAGSLRSTADTKSVANTKILKINALAPPISGLVKTSLLDYPGYVCATIFLSGCNFRCPYCHNRDLVIGSSRLSRIPPVEVLTFLQKRRTVLDGVCITGGEPTLTPNLPVLIRAVKELGLRVKLDTNGTKPDVLERLLADGLLDYVAMDIKAPREKYEKVSRAEVKLADLQVSIELLGESGIEHEFRTTVVPELLTERDLLEIGEWLQGSPAYVIQQFRPENTLDVSYQSLSSYAPEWFCAVADKLRPYFGQVEIRGL